MNRGNSPNNAGWDGLSRYEKRRVVLASARRPMHLLILLVGLVMFFTTLAFWIPPLTLATYGALVFFSSRDPFFRARVIEGRPRPGLPETDKEPSPDRRARWLPRGQTREKVEAALEVRRKTIAAIEESDEVTREVLSDAIPRLQELGNGLVDLAHRRETTSSEALELHKELQKRAPNNQRSGDGLSGRSDHDKQAEIQPLQQEVERMDRELEGMVERLLTLRSRVVRVSLESGDPAREAAGSLMRELDNLNRRVEALGDTLEPPGGG